MKFQVGSRRSNLSKEQTEEVLNLLRKESSASFEIVNLDILGDKADWKSIGDIDDTGVFTRELDEALLNNEIDFAVHSSKDVPSELHNKLQVGAVVKRASPRDVIVGKRLNELKEGAKVGTGSPRRKAQILRKNPVVDVVPIRGNVETRIEKVGKEVDAVVLAEIGLKRLGLEEKISEVLPIDDFLPAPGQAALTITCRREDKETLKLLEKINHEDTRMAVEAEKAVLKEFGAGCTIPVGTFAEVVEGKIEVKADYLKDYHRVEMSGKSKNATEIGIKAAKELKNRSGDFK